MTEISTKDEWLSQADAILRQISTNRLNMKKLFPNKEHLQPKIRISKGLKLNFKKFFSKPLSSLVPIESITNLLKKANSVNIPPKNSIFLQLKKSNQRALMVQLRAKELVMSKNKTYNDVKYNLGEFFDIGISSKDANKLKAIMDDNRKIELSLCENYLNLEELKIVKEKLFEEQGKQIDKSFEILIKEKENKFKSIQRQLESVLMTTSLSPKAMKKMCLLLDQAEQVKFKLKQFKYICGIRDSFRWVHLLNKFLDSKDQSLARFEVMASRIRKIDITGDIDLKELKKKLIGLIKQIEENSDMPLFRAILEPVKDVDLTDDSIIDIIEFLKTSKWTLMVNKKLEAKDMRIDELEEIIKNVPAIKKRMKDESYLKVLKIYENAFETDQKITLLLDSLNEFVMILDKNEEVEEDDWVNEFKKFADLGRKLNKIVEEELNFVVDIRENFKLNKVKVIIKIVELHLKIMKKTKVEKSDLKELKILLLGCDIGDLKQLDMVQKVLKFHSENLKIIRFFERLNENDSLEMNLRDDIIVVKNYEKTISQEDNMIDYGEGKSELREKIELFQNWEEKVDQICEEYEIEKVEREFEDFKTNKAADFVKQINQLKIELKILSFKSLRVEKLLVLEWSLEALSLLLGSKKKMNIWLNFHKRSKSLSSIQNNLLMRVENQIANAEQLVIQGHEIYRENASYQDIRELQRQVRECRIDMSDELAIFKDRFQIEEELYKRINDVLETKKKLRLVEIEKLTDDIKSSGIDFGDLREKLEKSLQVCRAFAVAIKEMKKSPTEIKRAKQTYVVLPLISPNFELMLEKLAEEEELIEKMDEIINQSEKDEDFEKISELEMHLSHSKYYNFDESRLKLFKKKISILKKQSLKEEADFTISYVVIRSMRLESNDLTKKYPKDKELGQLNYFISEIDNEARSFLQNLSLIRNYKTFDKIKNVIYKFIDINSEIKDLKTKCRLNLQRSTNLFEIDSDTKVSTVSKLKNISSNGKKSKKFQLNLMNLKKNISQKSPKTQVPGFNDIEKTIPSKKKISQKKFDMRALRINLLNNLRYEIQRNPYISETESELKKIAAFIERTIFSKTFDGGYEIKMRRMIKLFSALVNMKKITFLVTLKSYDMNILVFLMEKSPLLLQQYEKNKERLLTDMGFGDFLKPDNNEGKVLGKRSPEGQLISNPVKKIKNSSSGVKSSNNSGVRNTEGRVQYQAQKKVDDVMKHKGRIVASLKTSMRNIQNNQRPLRKKEIDLLSNSVDIFSDNVRIKKRTETGNFVSEEETRKMYKDILLKPHMAETSTRNSITEAQAWKIFKGGLSIQTSTVSCDFKNISLMGLNSIYDIENTPKVNDPLVLKGSVNYRDFKNYMQKLFRKSSKVINLSLGFLHGEKETLLRLSGIFTPENSAFFVKYTDFSKILVFPKSLLNPNWSHFFKFNHSELKKLNCDLFYIVVLNLSILNSGKYPIPEFINPEPVQDLSFLEKLGPKEVELTPESSQPNSPYKQIFKSKDYHSPGKHSIEKNSNSLLNVLKYGGMANSMTNKAAIGVEVDSPRQKKFKHPRKNERKDSFGSQLSNPDLVQTSTYRAKKPNYNPQEIDYYKHQNYYPQMQNYQSSLGKRGPPKNKRKGNQGRKEKQKQQHQANPLISMLVSRKAVKNKDTPYEEIEAKGFNDSEASARRNKRKSRGGQRRLNALFMQKQGQMENEDYFNENRRFGSRDGSFEERSAERQNGAGVEYVNPLGKVNEGGNTFLYLNR